MCWTIYLLWKILSNRMLQCKQPWQSGLEQWILPWQTEAEQEENLGLANTWLMHKLPKSRNQPSWASSQSLVAAGFCVFHSLTYGGARTVCMGFAWKFPPFIWLSVNKHFLLLNANRIKIFPMGDFQDCTNTHWSSCIYWLPSLDSFFWLDHIGYYTFNFFLAK